MTTERAIENRAVARYDFALQSAIGMEPFAAVKFLLESFSDLSPSEFSKNPLA
jgi:hypothetical protein